MAVLDRATRRLIETLKYKVRMLTALTVVLAVALTVMTVLYITKDGEAYSAEVSSVTNIGSNGTTTAESDQSSLDETSSKEEGKASSENKASSDKVSSDSSSVVDAVATPGDDINSWNLKLVNSKNPLPNGFTVKTEKIKASYARDVGMLYDARAVSYLNAMCAAAEKDGINLLVISSHRTNARQTTLYNNQVNKQRANHPELSESEIKKKAATISAYPGTSEHELGLAVDFNSVEESFENTKEYQWLKTHAADYGFILRYTKQKQSITGVIYEPWHYRYVGEKHAKKINQLGYCLEEYIEYLKNNNK
ncbi:MAG: M15 family metallopeptidase [Clostridia bacterium]|nr:M15 family metallopeptidase [Clostridia bacterium]